MLLRLIALPFQRPSLERRAKRMLAEVNACHAMIDEALRWKRIREWGRQDWHKATDV